MESAVPTGTSAVAEEKLLKSIKSIKSINVTGRSKKREKAMKKREKAMKLSSIERHAMICDDVNCDLQGLIG
jgi:uncharacterized protein (DUF2344 family)